MPLIFLHNEEWAIAKLHQGTPAFRRATIMSEAEPIAEEANKSAPSRSLVATRSAAIGAGQVNNRPQTK